MSFGNLITLNNGVKMPQIGLGTWQSNPGEVERAVEEALNTGYRHIDAAYGNQKEVAEGIKRSGVPRKDIFLVSKLWNNSHRPELVEADLDNTLAELGTDYLDLYLIHWPVPFLPGAEMSATKARSDGKGDECVIDEDAPSITATWLKMTELLKGRKIGVSNFTIEHLEKLAAVSDVIPAVNQIEAHPLLQQDELMSYCAKKNIHGQPPVINHSRVAEVAASAGASPSPAQVLIAWAASRGFSVIPKSVTPARIQSNFQQIKLDDAAIATISALSKTEGRMRYNTPMVYEPRWDINVFGEDVEKSASRAVW